MPRESGDKLIRTFFAASASGRGREAGRRPHSAVPDARKFTMMVKHPIELILPYFPTGVMIPIPIDPQMPFYAFPVAFSMYSSGSATKYTLQ